MHKIEKVLNSKWGKINYRPNETIERDDYYKSGIYIDDHNTVYKGKNYIEYKNDEKLIVVSELDVKKNTNSRVGELQEFKGVMFKSYIKKLKVNDNILIYLKKPKLNIVTIIKIWLLMLILGGWVLPKEYIFFMFGIIVLIGFLYKEIVGIIRGQKSIELSKNFNKYFCIIGEKEEVKRKINIEIVESLINFYKKNGISVKISIKNKELYLLFDNITIFDNDSLDFSVEIENCIEINNLLINELNKDRRDKNEI